MRTPNYIESNMIDYVDLCFLFEDVKPGLSAIPVLITEFVMLIQRVISYSLQNVPKTSVKFKSGGIVRNENNGELIVLPDDTKILSSNVIKSVAKQKEIKIKNLNIDLQKVFKNLYKDKIK